MAEDVTASTPETTETQVADSATPSPEQGGTDTLLSADPRARAMALASQVMPEPGDTPAETESEPSEGDDQIEETETESAEANTAGVDDRTREYGRAVGLTDEQIDGLGSAQAVRYVASQQIGQAMRAPAGQTGDEPSEPAPMFERLGTDDLGFSVPDSLRAEYGDDAADAMQAWANGIGKTLIDHMNGVIDRLNEYDTGVIAPIEQANHQRQITAAVDRVGTMIASTPGISPDARAIFGVGPADELSDMQFESRREVLDSARDLRLGMQGLGRTVPSPEQAVMMVLMERGLIGNNTTPAAPQVSEPPRQPPARRGTPLGRPGQRAQTPPPQNEQMSLRDILLKKAAELAPDGAF